MKIAHLHIDTPVFLAPLAGITDSVFRRMARELGAEMVYSEMVSAQGLIYGGAKTFRLMEFTERERPIGVQIFGADPETMARAAEIVTRQGPDLIDLNFGCPARKVVGKNGGSALMKDLDLLGKIVRAVADATDLPVTAKIRSGWDRDSIVAVEAAERCAENGAAAIALHPRTRQQGFSGQADWDIIARVKEAVDIPVIGNGDIRIPQDGLRMMQQTGCDAIMIGRGVLGNPWLLGQTSDLLAGRAPRPDPTAPERIETCLLHARRQVEENDLYSGIRQMRKHFCWYTKGLPDGAQLRNSLVLVEDVPQAERIFRSYLQEQTARRNELRAAPANSK